MPRYMDTPILNLEGPFFLLIYYKKAFLSKTMVRLLIRANKNALFAKYMNKEPRTVIPAKAGIQTLQLKKDPLDARPLPSRGMLFGHDESLMFFLKDLKELS